MKFLLLVLSVYLLTLLVSIRLQKLPRKAWPAIYIVGLLLVIIINLFRYVPSLINSALFQFFTSHSKDLILLGVSAILVIIPTLPQLSRRTTKYLLVVFLLVVVLRSSILPSACFLVNRNELINLKNKFDKDNVCRQSTDYTCGPAAVVTVLKALGIDDTEAQVAIQTRCNSYSGTRFQDLVAYINRKYNHKGISAEYKYTKNLAQLMKMKGYYIVDVKANLFMNHYIAILGFENEDPIVADPYYGKFRASKDTFSKSWHKKVIVVRKTET